MRLATGRAYYPCEENGTFKYGHEEAADALFFFENMQGDQPYDKRQDADEDGELDHPGLPPHLQQPDKDYSKYRPKDNVPYGTYIEVDAYYRSINEEKVGSGDIKYRFMLGKNITTNYDAERNHHYKLTLKFKILQMMQTGISNMLNRNQVLRCPIPIIFPIYITERWICL